LKKGIIDKSYLKILNGQLNKNGKFDIFWHLKRNGGSSNFVLNIFVYFVLNIVYSNFVLNIVYFIYLNVKNCCVQEIIPIRNILTMYFNDTC
jgi:hypothetical protein